MEDIPHIRRNVVKFRYPTNYVGSRAQNAVQAVQASGRETNKENYSSQAWGDKRMDNMLLLNLFTTLPYPSTHWWRSTIYQSTMTNNLSAWPSPCASMANRKHIIFHPEDCSSASSQHLRKLLVVIAILYRHNLV